MFDFFRRYQRAIFIVIAFFVIISFSFFGTYNVIGSMRTNTATAFEAVDGTTVTRGEVDELAAFISSDAEDKLAQGGAWGANFLNDGVIRKDFLESGLALVLAEKFAPILGADLQGKLEREKRFFPYRHPQAPFLNANSVWNYFAPDINAQLSVLQQQDNASTAEAMQARINLYLAERKFPEPMLKQILHYQQKQYGWLKPDEEMLRSDLSLFGYHNLSDWFGQRFTRLVAEFIINSAIQAKQMGYEVSKEEALADLLRNSAASYQQMADNPMVGAANGAEYFKQQLQRMSMDQNQAARLWQQVLLFRRLYNNAGSLPLVDQSVFGSFGAYAGEGVSGDLYALPKELNINSFRMLQALEVYIKSVSKKGSDPLALPTVFANINEIIERNPELVQKRYLLNISSVDKRSLQGRVSVNEMWNWELTDGGWEKLKTEFPELAASKAATAADRQGALDKLDRPTRMKVDFFARKAIVDEHPEWLSDALEKAVPEKEIVSISYRGGATPFVDLKDNASLIKLLDMAPIANGSSVGGSEDQIAAQARLKRFSADEQNYYKIEVLEKPQGPELIAFSDAYSRGLIDPFLEAALKGYYLIIREKSPEKFKNQDGNWKSFEDVRNEIAEDYFAIVLKNIRDDAVAAGLLPKDAPPLSPDRAASLRFYKYMRTLREKAAADAAAIDAYIREPSGISEEEKSVAEATNPADQWKVERIAFSENRSSKTPAVNLIEAFEMAPNAWSKVAVPVNGALSFYQLNEKGAAGADVSLFQKTLEVHQLLGNEAKQKLAAALTEEMIKKQAISLEFMEGSADGGAVMETPGTMTQE